MAGDHGAKWGHKERYLLGTYGEELFTVRFVEGLRERFGFDSPPEALKHHLERSADIYRINKNNGDDGPKPKNIKAALREIRNLSAKLTERLEELDDRSWRHLWAPEGSIRDQGVIGTALESEYGHTFHRIQLSESEKVIFYLERAEIERAIRILTAYGDRALREMPSGRAGAPSLHALQLWVMNLRTWWAEIEGRPYTLDYHQGVGTTEAYAFTWEALQAVDRTVTEKELVTAMRAVIKDHRKREARKNPQSEN